MLYKSISNHRTQTGKALFLPAPQIPPCPWRYTLQHISHARPESCLPSQTCHSNNWQQQKDVSLLLGLQEYDLCAKFWYTDVLWKDNIWWLQLCYGLNRLSCNSLKINTKEQVKTRKACQRLKYQFKTFKNKSFLFHWFLLMTAVLIF